ncbi:glycosyltransferase [Fidelibacter multiformis]|jgi:cellulose synthase/poly-beta-1,6-N-acetylglucosamine synthase-like glycosyltransferase|uniref:glycosyltransferase family 2 protein n=1 Tax=Fidelibacter multiformis TaxID=3377529 RepID=UPI0037DCE6E4
MIDIPRLFLDFFNHVVLAYFFILNTVYLILNSISFISLRRYARSMRVLQVDELINIAGALPITLIAPAYNEGSTIVESTRSLLALKYPDFEIITVNDGSKDDTLKRVIENFDMIQVSRAPIASLKTADVKAVYRSRKHYNLWLIDKENGGKADALNCGLNYARTPLYCAMDSDSLLERDSLTRIVRPFLENKDTIAAGGIIRIANGCDVRGGEVKNIKLPKNQLARFQVMEYLRAFLAGRMGWDSLNLTFIISGAFGIFKRGIAIAAGGYHTQTVGEDMELVVRLHRYCIEHKIPYHITFIPDPVAWTECPESMKVLGRQRDRWQRGLMEVLFRHKKMLMNPRYGRIGMLAYPYFFFLEMCGPLIEVPGYILFLISWMTGNLSTMYVSAFFILAFIFGVNLSIFAVGLEELTFKRYGRFRDLLNLFWLAVVENFGYRQLTTYWRARGTWSFFRKVKSWGAMERKGFQTIEADRNTKP